MQIFFLLCLMTVCRLVAQSLDSTESPTAEISSLVTVDPQIMMIPYMGDEELMEEDLDLIKEGDVDKATSSGKFSQETTSTSSNIATTSSNTSVYNNSSDDISKVQEQLQISALDQIDQIKLKALQIALLQELVPQDNILPQKEKYNKYLEELSFKIEKQDKEQKKLTPDSKKDLFLYKNFNNAVTVFNCSVEYITFFTTKGETLAGLVEGGSLQKSALRISSLLKNSRAIYNNCEEIRTVAESIGKLTEVVKEHNFSDALMEDIQRCIDNYVAGVNFMVPHKITPQQTWIGFITGSVQPEAEIMSDLKEARESFETAFQAEREIYIQIADQLEKENEDLAEVANSKGDVENAKRLKHLARIYERESAYLDNCFNYYSKMDPEETFYSPTSVNQKRKEYKLDLPFSPENKNIRISERRKHISAVINYCDRAVKAASQGGEWKKYIELLKIEHEREAFLWTKLYVPKNFSSSIAREYLTLAFHEMQESSAVSFFGKKCADLDPANFLDYDRASFIYFSSASKAYEDGQIALSEAYRWAAQMMARVTIRAYYLEENTSRYHFLYPLYMHYMHYNSDSLIQVRELRKGLEMLQEKIREVSHLEK